jgi:hypothetical protein
MTPNDYINLAGNCTAIAICLYMLNYFMKRDEQREKKAQDREDQLREIVNNNTQAVTHNTELICELKKSISEKISIFEGLRDVVKNTRSANGSR